MVCMCHKLLINEFCNHTNSTYRRWLVIYLRWRYTVNVPILMCPNNNLVLMCYVLVNEVDNKIHNLLQITFSLRVFTGSARPYSSITRQTCWCPTMYSCDQWIKKNFHHHYWTMQAANHPRLAYYNTNNSMFNISESWTDRFVCCPWQQRKRFFPIEHCTLLDTSMSAVYWKNMDVRTQWNLSILLDKHMHLNILIWMQSALLYS